MNLSCCHRIRHRHALIKIYGVECILSYIYAVVMRFLVAVYKFSNKVNGLFISIKIKNLCITVIFMPRFM